MRDFRRAARIDCLFTQFAGCSLATRLQYIRHHMRQMASDAMPSMMPSLEYHLTRMKRHRRHTRDIDDDASCELAHILIGWPLALVIDFGYGSLLPRVNT